MKITEQGLKEIGFVWNGDSHVYSFQNDGLCVCVMENEWHFLNYFTKKPLQRWTLIISGMDSEDDCFTYNVTNIEQVLNRIDSFDAKGRQGNRFIAKFVAIVVISIILSLILAKCN